MATVGGVCLCVNVCCAANNQWTLDVHGTTTNERKAVATSDIVCNEKLDVKSDTFTEQLDSNAPNVGRTKRILCLKGK